MSNAKDNRIAQLREQNRALHKICALQRDSLAGQQETIAQILDIIDRMREMECQNDAVSTDHEGGASYGLNFYLDDFCSYGERREV